jgi:hypothetical protein
MTVARVGGELGHMNVPPELIDRAVPEGTHTVLVAVNALVLGGCLMWGLLQWWRTRTPLFLVLLGAGFIAAIVVEPYLDAHGHIWFYKAATVVTVTGRPVLLWWFLTYSFFIAGTTWVFYRIFRDGRTRRHYWRAFGWFCVINAAIEVPFAAIVHSVYNYYGPQPLNLGGWPLWWMFVNCGGALGAAVLWGLRAQFRGVRVLLALLVVPSCFFAWEVLTSWPMWFAFDNSWASGYAITYPAVIVTIGISLYAHHLISQVMCTPQARPVPADQPAEEAPRGQIHA